MIQRLPIRVRLTLWYFAMFASAATLLCAVSLWMLQRSADEIEYHDLQERAQDVQSVLSHQSTDLSMQQIRDDFVTIYEWKDDGKYFQVRDEEGHWLYHSKRMAEQNPDSPTISDLPKKGLVTNLHLGSQSIRVLSYPIEVRGKRYLVQTGISMKKSGVLLANFRTKLLLLMPIVILLAAAGGHLMSRKALKPIAVLTSETRRISERNLDIRLPVPGTRDEIFDLSQTLNQMLERIDKAFASVRTFTGNASHELRTPISLLRTEIEVALYRPRDSEEYRAILARLHEDTVRLTTLVENLLSLARADGGAETIVLAPIRLETIFRRAAETWKSAMAHAMLDFRVEIPEGDLVVLGGMQGISRLLSILLENACKFTPPGGSVVLSAASRSAEILVSVRDTGIGIAPEHISRVFDRFYHSAPVREHVVAGSGLGLAIAKWIAERHGMELSVESEPGHGACFSFRLSRVYSNPSADDALSVSPSKPKEELKLVSPHLT